MLSTHTDIRDTLVRCRVGDIEAFEHVLSMIEDAIKVGLQEHEAKITEEQARLKVGLGDGQEPLDDAVSSSEEMIAKYKRPWWICQPHIRILPEEALKIGALKLSKKEMAKAEAENEVFKLKTRLKEAQHKIDRLHDYERQIEQFVRMQRLW